MTIATYTPKVSAEVVRYLLSQAKKYNVDYSSILEELELPLEPDPAGICSFKYGQLYRRLIFLTKDEWFGMFAGGVVPIGAFRLMCLILVTAANLRQAFELAGEFSEVTKGFSVRLVIDEYQGLARLKLGPTRDCPPGYFEELTGNAHPDRILTNMVAFHQLAGWLCGTQIKIEGLRLSFKAGQTLQSVRSLCEQDVQYEQGYNALIYSLDTLDMPIVQNQHALPEFLRSAPYQLVTQTVSQISATVKVRSLLNRDIGHNMPSAERVAEMLNMSVTTLRRHLADENTSYQTLKDECRLEGAIQLLACRDMTNIMVAERLGFDEPSAFFRAFKKWTGITPGQYRKRYFDDFDETETQA